MALANKKNTALLHPGWLIPITVIAGLMVSGPLAGATIFAHGRRRLGWAAACVGFALGAAILAAMFLWDRQWHWVGIALTGINLSAGTFLFFALSAMFPAWETKAQEKSRPQRGTFRHVIAGIIGGFMGMCFMGTVCIVVYLLVLDRLFSTWFPVTFDDQYAIFRLAFSGFCLSLAGGLAGGIGGRTRPGTTPGRFLLYCLVLIFTYLSWSMAVDAAIAIPGFQAGPATGKGWMDIFKAMGLGEFLIGICWAVFLFFYIIAPTRLKNKAWRALAVVGMNLAAAATLAVTFGYPAETYLALGQHFERQAYISKALWCYERGLRKMPDDNVASFLQYRSALINHKLGNQDHARQGFSRLVAKYNSNKRLVKKSSRFLDSLKRSAGKKRVVLPGVETRTEYKSAYCVPNSLALTMRFWGSDINAREIGRKITGLSGGTYSVNQAWFARQMDFRHDFLPMAGMDDIKRCIDAGFPVMVYVPSHVLVIFGYDEALETFVTYDTATSGLWSEYIQKDFIKAWKKKAATVILAYPPKMQSRLPKDIALRLTALSDNYLHYQLYGLDAPSGSISVPHLMAAAGDTGEFFIPVTLMYSKFPGLRQELSEKYDTDKVMESIRAYFWEDFDEGIHQWGQYHDDDRATSDAALKNSISYLIGNRRFDMVESLITRIDDKGPVSGNMLGNIGMIDLVSGDYDRGLDRIARALNGNVSTWTFYLGLAHLKDGDTRQAIRELVRAVERKVKRFSGKRQTFKDSWSYARMGLDDYGFPARSVANRILAQTKNLGESEEALSPIWEIWVHYMPFDAPVAKALSQIYTREIQGMDKKTDERERDRLSIKLRLAEKRAERYDIENFSK